MEAVTPEDEEFASELDLANYFIPSPAEIARVCAEIRAGWSERERESRHVGKPRVMVDENRVHRVNCGE